MLNILSEFALSIDLLNKRKNVFRLEFKSSGDSYVFKSRQDIDILGKKKKERKKNLQIVCLPYIRPLLSFMQIKGAVLFIAESI